MRRLICAALLVSLVSACGHSNRNKHKPITMIGNLSVSFPDSHQTRNDLLADAVEIHLRAFEEDYGRESRFGTCAITSAATIPCGNLPGDYSGCCYLDQHHIEVTAGDYLEVPALYHELWHLNIGDPYHEDPRWPEWNIRGYEISYQIRLSRAGIDFNKEIEDCFKST